MHIKIVLGIEGVWEWQTYRVATFSSPGRAAMVAK